MWRRQLRCLKRPLSGDRNTSLKKFAGYFYRTLHRLNKVAGCLFGTYFLMNFWNLLFLFSFVGWGWGGLSFLFLLVFSSVGERMMSLFIKINFFWALWILITQWLDLRHDLLHNYWWIFLDRLFCASPQPESAMLKHDNCICADLVDNSIISMVSCNFSNSFLKVLLWYRMMWPMKQKQAKFIGPTIQTSMGGQFLSWDLDARQVQFCFFFNLCDTII